MTTKKKKPSRRPPRRTAYQAALHSAQTRLEKATRERTEALNKIDALNREIPYLEGIVLALTPPPIDAPERTAAATVKHIPAAPRQSQPAMDQEEFLSKFMPRAGRVTSTAPAVVTPPQPDGTNPDPDEFLSDDGPGQEILS